jgi:ribosomal protein L37AE/L43A
LVFIFIKSICRQAMSGTSQGHVNRQHAGIVQTSVHIVPIQGIFRLGGAGSAKMTNYVTRTAKERHFNRRAPQCYSCARVEETWNRNTTPIRDRILRSFISGHYDTWQQRRRAARILDLSNTAGRHHDTVCVGLPPYGHTNLALVSGADNHCNRLDVDFGSKNPGISLRRTVSLVQTCIFHLHVSRPRALQPVSGRSLERTGTGIRRCNECGSSPAGSFDQPPARARVLSK